MYRITDEVIKSARIPKEMRRDLRAEIEDAKAKGIQSYSAWQRHCFDSALDQIEAGMAPEDVMQVLFGLTQIAESVSTNSQGNAMASEWAFSPGPDCKNLILRELNKATQILDICVFTISDDEITKAILAAHRKGVCVRLLTDNDKSFDAGSDIQQLADEGIEVRVDQTENHMHHKFMIRDKKAVLTGSYNWTRSAERYNQENILLMFESPVVQQYEIEFNRLWGELLPYDFA
jgi:phosphatidylserine/phosphatidylglycerophosphate/cardiolipin synthase-like enzyme